MPACADSGTSRAGSLATPYEEMRRVNLVAYEISRRGKWRQRRVHIWTKSSVRVSIFLSFGSYELLDVSLSGFYAVGPKGRDFDLSLQNLSPGWDAERDRRIKEKTR